MAIFNIALGLLCGSVFGVKQVGGICGALLTNLSAWLSGTWFDLTLIGGTFEKAAELLPFVHGVNAGRCALSGDYTQIIPELLWVMVYALVLCIFAVAVFRHKMKQDK